jgi:hypothetical protein
MGRGLKRRLGKAETMLEPLVHVDTDLLQALLL